VAQTNKKVKADELGTGGDVKRRKLNELGPKGLPKNPPGEKGFPEH